MQVQKLKYPQLFQVNQQKNSKFLEKISHAIKKVDHYMLTDNALIAFVNILVLVMNENQSDEIFFIIALKNAKTRG